MKIVVVILILLLGLTLFAGFKYTRVGYETPDYQILRKDGPFEVREYSRLVLVVTLMEGGPSEGDSFGRLFRYISGANQSGQKIAMTTPVLMSMEGTERQMGFIVPNDVARAGVPAASSGQVKIEDREGGRFAAYRFSGSWDLERFGSARGELSRWIEEQGLKVAGEFQVAGYDPPFIPPFLRRNEILVRLSDE